MLTVFSKPNCPNCVKLKGHLTSMDIEFDTKDISLDSPAREFVIRAGHRSVPQVYDDTNLIGGFDDIINKSKEQIIRLMEV